MDTKVTPVISPLDDNHQKLVYEKGNLISRPKSRIRRNHSTDSNDPSSNSKKKIFTPKTTSARKKSKKYEEDYDDVFCLVENTSKLTMETALLPRSSRQIPKTRRI